MKTSYLVKLHRVNPVTKCCDDSGILSEFYSSSTLSYLKHKAKLALRCHIYTEEFFMCDNDVYYISILNCNTHKNHIVV